MKFKKTFFIVACTLILTSFIGVPALSAAPSRVLILPFDIHSDRDLSFLRSGIQAMLSTRLTLAQKAAPIPPEESGPAVASMPQPIGQQAAILLGVSLGADYVVFGSLTVFGSSISTDVRFIDARQQKAVITFNQMGRDNGEVIAHVNAFAEQVRTKVFGMQPQISAAPAAQPLQARPSPVPGNTTRTHPEALWAARTGAAAGYIQTAPNILGRPEGAMVSPATAATSWKSPKIKEQIRGLAVGDVDGDGKNETVYITKKLVTISRWEQGRLVKLGEIEGSTADDFLNVDVGDINQNGKAEIFVTNIHENANRLQSFVLEWNEREFQRIIDDQNWFYRVIDIPSRGGAVLLGQLRGIKSPFSNPDKWEMAWQNGRYEKANRLKLPKSLTVYGIAYGNALNDGREVAVTITKSERLQVLDRSGEEEITSDDTFGNGTVYVRVPSAIQIKTGSKDDFHLPQRIVIADLDKNGKNEILVAKNEDLFGGMAPRSRVYKKGRIECLVADRLGFTPKWRTRDFRKQVADFCLADMDNDGNLELGFVVVLKTDTTVISKPASIIVVQELPN